MKRLLKNLKNMKVQILILLGILFLTALFHQPALTQSTLWIQLASSITIAILAEFAFFGAVKSSSIQSATITGAIVALLLAPGIDLKILWFTVSAAIASKALLHFPSGRHIFNPAATGLLLTTCFFSNRINWWGFSNPYIIIVLGGFILFNLNRLALVFSYILFRCLGVLVFSNGILSIDMFMLHNLFFIFIMLVEPMTTPYKRVKQWQFGGGTALLASLFFSVTPSFGGDLMALLSMNLLRPVLRGK